MDKIGKYILIGLVVGYSGFLRDNSYEKKDISRYGPVKSGLREGRVNSGLLKVLYSLE